MARMIGALLLLAAAGAAQDEAKELTANLSVRGKLAFSEDFSAKELPKDWKAGKGKWEVVDGALRGAELAADQHAAVIKHPLPGRHFILGFRFKFDGAKRAAVSFDGKGHVCRVLLTPQGFTLQKDGTKDGTEKPARLGTGTVDFKPGEWHSMLIEVQGKEMLAQVDDKVFAFGEHAGIDQDKSTFGFPVTGEGFVVDSIRVWEATPNPDWAANKQKLPSGR